MRGRNPARVMAGELIVDLVSLHNNIVHMNGRDEVAAMASGGNFMKEGGVGIVDVKVASTSSWPWRPT